jgi:thiamine biosynthesis protein ThiS
MEPEEALVSSEIEVRLNGKPRRVPAGLTVAALLDSLDLRRELVVVELNREILKRESYGAVPVSAGDTVELVHFVGGG